MVYDASERSPITVSSLQRLKADGAPITMLTCYDASFGRLLDRCGVECILVGDSLGMVIQGGRDTLAVTLSDMEYHTRIVSRGVSRSLVIADMPFGTYQTSPEDAYKSAVVLMRAGANMVKLEGGEWLAETVSFLTERGVPVCAHIGLMPQSVNTLGGYRVQGRGSSGALLVEDALCLEEAGAKLLVVEAVPSTVARAVTAQLSIPTIGIGAGGATSGQVLVLHDLLGVTFGKRPRFVKNFLDEAESIESAVQNFVAEVKSGRFPGPEHEYSD